MSFCDVRDCASPDFDIHSNSALRREERYFSESGWQQSIQVRFHYSITEGQKAYEMTYPEIMWSQKKTAVPFGTAAARRNG
jgi:hypothetical protein